MKYLVTTYDFDNTKILENECDAYSYEDGSIFLYRKDGNFIPTKAFAVHRNFKHFIVEEVDQED
jgi:hypothetical protein